MDHKDEALMTSKQRTFERQLNAANMRLKRAAARATGICQTCLKQPKEPVRSTCVDCTKLKRKWNDAHAAQAMQRTALKNQVDRFCVDCAMHAGHRVGCTAARIAA